jgi:hypothetical protein
MNKWFFGIVILILSCKPKPECNIAETVFYEKKEPFVEVFTISQLRKMEDSTRSRLCNEDYFWSDLKVGNLHIPTDIYVKGKCDRYPGIYCFFSRPETVFRVVDSTEVVFNDSLVFIKDLGAIFHKHFAHLDTLDVKEWQKNTVIVDWDTTASDAEIELALRELMNTYASYLKERYKKEGKPFDCEEHKAKVARRRKSSEDIIVKNGITPLQPMFFSIDLRYVER